MTIELAGSGSAVRQLSTELLPLLGSVSVPFTKGAMAVVSAISRNTQEPVAFDWVTFNGISGTKVVSGVHVNGLDNAEVSLWLIPVVQLEEGTYETEVSVQGDPGSLVAFVVHVYAGVKQSVVQGDSGFSTGIGGRAYLPLSSSFTEVIVDAFGGLQDEAVFPGEGYTLLGQASSSATDPGFVSAAKWNLDRSGVAREGGTTLHWIMCGVALQEGPP